MAEKVSINYSDVAAIVLKLAFPYGWKSIIPGYDLYKLMVEPLAQKVINSANLSKGNDLENIKEIIISGRNNGVDELEIRISKETGINIGADLNTIGIPCDMKFNLGSQGETIINIKYK